MKRPFLLLVLLAGFARDGLAHEVRPAYLELRQSGSETYDVLWKVPGRGEEERFGLYVELPAACTNLAPPRSFFINNAFTDRWTVRCAGGLTDGTIHVAGLASTVTDVLVRLERLDGRSQVLRLTPSAPTSAHPGGEEKPRPWLLLIALIWLVIAAAAFLFLYSQAFQIGRT